MYITMNEIDRDTMERIQEMNLAAYVRAGLPLGRNQEFAGGYNDGVRLAKALQRGGVELTQRNCMMPEQDPPSEPLRPAVG